MEMWYFCDIFDSYLSARVVQILGFLDAAGGKRGSAVAD